MTGFNRISSRRRKPKLETLLAAYGDNCWLCGEPLLINTKRRSHPLAVTFDHVVPVAEGGTSANENLRLAHRICNNDRVRRFPDTLDQGDRPTRIALTKGERFQLSVLRSVHENPMIAGVWLPHECELLVRRGFAKREEALIGGNQMTLYGITPEGLEAATALDDHQAGGS